MIMLPGLLIAFAWRPPFGPVIGASAVLVACSTIPGLLFYPVVHTMMGVFAALSLTLYLILAWVLAAASRRWLSSGASS